MEREKCNHPACSCEAAKDGFCSALCTTSVDGAPCDCGHSECNPGRLAGLAGVVDRQGRQAEIAQATLGESGE
jgi:hypothetical protein